MLRLERLPFDESDCDWDTPLTVWRHYHQVITCKTKEYTQSQPRTQMQPISETKQPSAEDSTQSEDTPTEGDCLDPGISTSVSPSVMNENPITFRVTCTRGGGKHSFSSMDAARCFGAGLARRFGWKVQLKNPDLEVLLTIMGEEMTVAIALNHESKHKRNIQHFGPTTLRSTIAYGLLRYVHACMCYR